MKYEDDTDVLNFDYSTYVGKYVKVFVSSFFDINRNKFDIFVENLTKTAEMVEVLEIASRDFSPELENSGDDLSGINLDNRKMVDSYLKTVSEANNLEYESISKLFFEILEEAKTQMESD